MKARRKGTNDDWQDVQLVALSGQDWTLINADCIEFQHDTLSTELKTYDQMGLESQSQDHWQDVRERAAIAAMQGLCANPNLISTDTFETHYNISVRRALEFADALVKQLNGGIR